MGLRETILRKGAELLSDPRVAKLAHDERVIRTVIGLVQLRGRLSAAIEGRVEQVASRLQLATKSEVQELRRTMRRLERQVGEKPDGTNPPKGG